MVNDMIVDGLLKTGLHILYYGVMIGFILLLIHFFFGDLIKRMKENKSNGNK